MDPTRVTRQTLTFRKARVASAKALVPHPVKAFQEEVRTERSIMKRNPSFYFAVALLALSLTPTAIYAQNLGDSKVFSP